MPRITRVSVENLGGVKGEIAFELGTVTVIKGENGSNKSSILDGIKKVFEGGHDASLLRRGAKIGRASLTLDDGRVASVQVTKRGTDYSVKSPQGVEMPAPRTLIQEMAALPSVDPSRLLRAKPSELSKVLLEIMPVSITRDEFNGCIVDGCFPDRAPVGMGGQAFEDMTLEEVEAQRKQIYEVRRQINQQARDYEGELRNLESRLTPQDESGTNWEQRAQELNALLKEGEESYAAQRQAIDKQEAADIAAIRAEAERLIEEVRSKSKAKREEIWQENEPQIRKIAMAAAEAAEKVKSYYLAEGLREQAENIRRRFAESEAKASALSRTLDNIAELKEGKLSKLPIPGLEVREGEVFYDGLPIERINLAQRMAIMSGIATRMKGDVPLLLWDGGEAFDAEMMRSLQQFAEKKQVQILITRVIDQGPLQIERLDVSTEEQVQQELLTAAG